MLGFLGLFPACRAQDNGVRVLTPQEFVEAVRNDSTAVVLDVRKPSEFAEGHLPHAVNIDWLDSSRFEEAIRNLDKKHTYYIYCRSGRRSNAAAEMMKKAGFSVYDMKGGYLAYGRIFGE